MGSRTGNFAVSTRGRTGRRTVARPVTRRHIARRIAASRRIDRTFGPTIDATGSILDVLIAARIRQARQNRRRQSDADQRKQRKEMSDLAMNPHMHETLLNHLIVYYIIGIHPLQLFCLSNPVPITQVTSARHSRRRLQTAIDDRGSIGEICRANVVEIRSRTAT